MPPMQVTALALTVKSEHQTPLRLCFTVVVEKLSQKPLESKDTKHIFGGRYF